MVGKDADKEKVRLQPTIVAAPVRRQPSVVSAPAPKPAPAARRAIPPADLTQPTAMLGTARPRLAVTAADLDRVAPAAERRVIEAALAQLARYLPDKASEHRAVLWGHDLQKAYAESIRETLDLSHDPMLDRVQGHVARMLDILTSFDLEMMAGSAGSGLVGLFKAMNSRIDTPAELDKARAELEHLVQLLGGSLEGLLQLKARLQTNDETQQTIAMGVEAAAVAARFLSQHYRIEQPSLSETFLDRAISLTQTMTQIRGNAPVRALQVEQPLRLIAAIQKVALVAMPDFLAALAAMNALTLQRRVPSLTEARELNHKRTDIVSQLKKSGG